jgi:hypothetical protein
MSNVMIQKKNARRYTMAQLPRRGERVKTVGIRSPRRLVVGVTIRTVSVPEFRFIRRSTETQYSAKEITKRCHHSSTARSINGRPAAIFGEWPDARRTFLTKRQKCPWWAAAADDDDNARHHDA